MTDESLFPPRCCRQQIPMAYVRIFLNSELVQAFEKKKIEFETPNRTYCYLPTCSAFINTQNISGERAACLECGSMTCTMCKGAAHTGDCLNDASLQQVLDTARENGWQRCYSCWRLVELDHGCNHMTLVLNPTSWSTYTNTMAAAVVALSSVTFADKNGRVQAQQVEPKCGCH